MTCCEDSSQLNRYLAKSVFTASITAYSSSSTRVINDVLPPDAVVSILMVFSVIKR
jgi:hypothetical protein